MTHHDTAVVLETLQLFGKVCDFALKRSTVTLESRSREKNDRNDHEVHGHQDLSSPEGLHTVTSLRITMKCQMPLSNKARKRKKDTVCVYDLSIPSLKSYLRNPMSHLHQHVNISLMLVSESRYDSK